YRAHEIEKAAMKRAHRRRDEIETLAAPIRCVADDRMVDEIENDLDPARAVRNHRCGQSSRRDVERRVPRMVDPRSTRQAILADDLQIEVQRRARVAPRKIVELRPTHRCGALAHADATIASTLQ